MTMSRRALSEATGHRLLLAAKALLAGLLLTGALLPSVGGFAGKGFAFRLPLFLLPAVIVPLVWRLRGRRRPYPLVLDAALTLPFLFDTVGNAVGAYDHWDHTDDVLRTRSPVAACGG